MSIRQANLDDTQAISELFRAGIERWQRMDTGGQVEDLAYVNLSIYERWLHGGAWMSIETGAVWLSHLVGGAGLAFVLTEDDAIIAYVEAYISQEPEPYNYHLHIGDMMADSDNSRRLLVEHLMAQASNIGRITVACPAYDHDTSNFYKSLGFDTLNTIQHMTLSSYGATVGFYKVNEHEDTNIQQIKNWQMPLGRVGSARMHWEQLWTQLWGAIPEMKQRQTHRLKFNAAGQDAYVCIQQDLYNPRNAEVFCWTPKAVSKQLMGSIRDWAYKAGYRSLSLAVDETTADILGSDLEPTPYQHIILAKDV